MPPLPAAPPPVAAPRVTEPPEVPIHLYELMEIDAAMRARDCRMVDEITLMLGVTPAQQDFVHVCHARRQREIIPAAMAANDCGAVLRIPGMYPRAVSADAQRFVYHCWMAAPQMDLDSCIGMMEVGDASSVPLIVATLRRNPPERMDDGRYAIIDTAGACIGAFERITRRKARDAARDWGGSWTEWAAAKN